MDFHIISGGIRDDGHQHDPQWQHRPWTQHRSLSRRLNSEKWTILNLIHLLVQSQGDCATGQYVRAGSVSRMPSFVHCSPAPISVSLLLLLSVDIPLHSTIFYSNSMKPLLKASSHKTYILFHCSRGIVSSAGSSSASTSLWKVSVGLSVTLLAPRVLVAATICLEFSLCLIAWDEGLFLNLEFPDLARLAGQQARDFCVSESPYWDYKWTTLLLNTSAWMLED